MIECKFCKTENSLDRILCVSCGKKLNLEHHQYIEAENHRNTKNKSKANIKIKMADDSIFKHIIKIALFMSICTSIFLILYNGHITFKELDINTVKSLNKKLKTLNKHYPTIQYVSFYTEEINLLIERALSSKKTDINKLFPNFFKFQKCFITINSYDIDIHLVFKIFKRDLIFTLKGLISIQNNVLKFEINKFYIGKHIITKALGRKLFKFINDSLSSYKLFKMPEYISSIKIEKKQLNVYLAKSALNNTLLESNDNVPVDVLLIQAGDSFFERNQYSLSIKYYNLAIAYVPNSPLKDYIKKQIRTIKENI